MTEQELDDDSDLRDNALNIDDNESSEQLKSRKTISNTTRTIDEFSKMVTGSYLEEHTHPITNEKYTVLVKVLEPQPNPYDRPIINQPTSKE